MPVILKGNYIPFDQTECFKKGTQPLNCRMVDEKRLSRAKNIYQVELENGHVFFSYVNKKEALRQSQALDKALIKNFVLMF